MRAPWCEGLDQVVLTMISIWERMLGITSGVLVTMHKLPILSSTREKQDDPVNKTKQAYRVKTFIYIKQASKLPI